MKHLLREYGFVTVLVFAGAGAYFLYTSRAGDLVESSLDSIGARLERMVEQPEDQASVSDVFESFREKVRSGAISPEQLERVETSILNMSRAGSHLAPEEAKALLEIAVIHPDSMTLLLSAAVLRPPTPEHPAVPGTGAPPIPNHASLKAAINTEFLDNIRALREKGYRPPHDVDSLLKNLDADIQRIVDSALVRAEAAAPQTGN